MQRYSVFTIAAAAAKFPRGLLGHYGGALVCGAFVFPALVGTSQGEHLLWPPNSANSTDDISPALPSPGRGISWASSGNRRQVLHKFHEQSSLDEKKAHVIVVGAGIAGLAAAYHLRKAGLRVTVLEKENRSADG